MTDTMQDDGLIERLRNRPNDAPMPTERLLDEAADRIAALRAENEALRAGLEQIDGQVSHTLMGDWSLAHKDIRKIARALLGSKP